MPQRGDRARAGLSAATAIFAVLVLATVASFAATRALRAGDDIVNSVRLARTLETGAGATIRFRLADPDTTADVLIIDSGGSQVRALVLGASLAAGDQRFRWDGRGDDGERVPPGRYRLQVRLGDQGREIEPPGTILVSRGGR